MLFAFANLAISRKGTQICPPSCKAAHAQPSEWLAFSVRPFVCVCPAGGGLTRSHLADFATCTRPSQWSNSSSNSDVETARLFLVDSILTVGRSVGRARFRSGRVHTGGSRRAWPGRCPPPQRAVPLPEVAHTLRDAIAQLGPARAMRPFPRLLFFPAAAAAFGTLKSALYSGVNLSLADNSGKKLYSGGAIGSRATAESRR